MITIQDSEFEQIRELVYSRLGIHLTDKKKPLVMSRLHKILKKHGFRDFSEYYPFLKSDRTGDALSTLADNISTNHTFFHREWEHVDFLMNTALPAVTAPLESCQERDLRIWCAGCSSGEEAYTLAIALMEFFGASYGRWNAGVLATDISSKVLALAQRGVYPKEGVDKLPANFRNNYFKLDKNGEYRVVDKVRKEVLFRRFNLMNKNYPFKRPFQIIFCRNVMIYFDKETRTRLAQRFYDLTVPGGYLFIGHSESLPRDVCPYQYVKPAVYRRPENNPGDKRWSNRSAS